MPRVWLLLLSLHAALTASGAVVARHRGAGHRLRGGNAASSQGGVDSAALHTTRKRHLADRHVASRHAIAVRKLRRQYQASKKASAVARRGKKRMNLNEALSRVPAKVGGMFLAFQKAIDSDEKRIQAASIQEELNDAYKAALADNDTMTLDCLTKTENLTQEVNIARIRLTGVETRLTQVQDRMQSLQAGIDRSLAEIQTTRAEFEQHRAACASNRKEDEARLKQLANDVPLAEALVARLNEGCTTGSGLPPLLIECTMPDGAVLATFKEKESRIEAAKMSGSTERLLSAALDAAGHRAQLQSTYGASFLGLSAWSRLVHGKKKHRGHKRHHLHMATAPEADIETHLCTDMAMPTCTGFADAMAAFNGSLQDFTDEISVRIQEAKTQCDASEASLTSVVQELKQQADEATVALAQSVAEQSDLAAVAESGRVNLRISTHEFDQGVGECSSQLKAIAETMLSTKTLWNQLKSSGAGTFVGDCEVSAWVPGPCSKECGTGGVQTLTRRKVLGVNNADCPVLQMERTCNERPCPVDAEMGKWEDWTSCSRPCGSGTRTRHRLVIKEAQFGGIPTAETMQEELCNPEPCDRDCELSSWNDWSDCSKACLKGHRSRVRKVIHPALGDGKCSAAEDHDRRETISCNDVTCNTTDGQKNMPVCASPLDLVLVFDGSGSVGDEGFTKTKDLASALLSRMLLRGETLSGDLIGPTGPVQISTNGARVGLVSFSGSANLVQDLSVDENVLLQRISDLQWPGSQVANSETNTAAALALARTALESNSEYPDARSVVLVITDGPPTNGRLVMTEVQRLSELGVRVAFLVVGEGAYLASVRRWASWPAAENVMVAESYTALPEDSKVTELLANLCPLLSFA